jgi:hypothetical protein
MKFQLEFKEYDKHLNQFIENYLVKRQQLSRNKLNKISIWEYNHSVEVITNFLKYNEIGLKKIVEEEI